MKKAILFSSVIVASALLGVTIYNTIVDAKSWGSDIPNSIQIARDYYKSVDPRNFYAIFGPINQVLILIAIVVFWRDSVRLRTYLFISFILYGLILLLTFAYFIPRDLVLFAKPIPNNVENIKTAWAQWNTVNWVRALLGLAGILCTLRTIDIYYHLRK